MKHKLFAIILSLCVAHAYSISPVEKLDQEAQRNEDEFYFIKRNSEERLFLDTEVETADYPFMNDIIKYITMSFDMFPTSIYSKDQMQKGFYNLDFSCYPEHIFPSPFSFSWEFKPQGSYFIEILFHREKTCLDVYNFKYGSYNFSTKDFLLPFFVKIKKNEVCPDLGVLDEDGFCMWAFEVYCGTVVRAYFSCFQPLSHRGIETSYFDINKNAPITEEEFRRHTWLHKYTESYNRGYEYQLDRIIYSLTSFL